MSLAARVFVAVLVVDAVALAALELLYLPLRIGGVAFPVTILVAAVSTPWLVRSAATASAGGRPSIAAAPLAAWVIAIMVFGVAGPGGDVLLAADWRSLCLLGGGLFPAAVALGGALARTAAARNRVIRGGGPTSSS
jgi:hypothetical protein